LPSGKYLKWMNIAGPIPNMPNDGDPDPPPINLRTVENLYDPTRPEMLPGEELQELEDEKIRENVDPLNPSLAFRYRYIL